MLPRVPAPRQCPVSALLHTRLTSECWKMGAKANLQTGSSEDINEVTGGPCTRPWPWSVPAVPCNKCNRLDSYCQHWRFCLGKVAACSSLLLGAKLLQLPVFIHDMNQNMCPIFFAAESPLQCWTIPGTGARQGPGLGCCYFQLQNFADGFYNFMLCNFGVSGGVASCGGQSVLLELGH